MMRTDDERWKCAVTKHKHQMENTRSLVTRSQHVFDMTERLKHEALSETKRYDTSYNLTRY